MIFAFAALAALIILLALVLCLPVSAGVEYENREGNAKLTVHARCLGIPFRIPISLGATADGGKKKKEKKKTKRKSSRKQESLPAEKKQNPLSRFFSVARGVHAAYKECREDIRELLSSIRAKTEFETVHFCVRFGLDNAAKTGITTGAVWTSASCLASVLDHMFGIKDMRLQVTPDFERECFSLYIKSIVRLRPVHIISIGLKIAKIAKLFIDKMNADKLQKN